MTAYVAHAIRQMRSSDAAVVAELACELGYPASAKDISERAGAISAEGHAVFVAEGSSGRVEAFLHVAAAPALIHDSMAEIVALVVREDRRGGGVGGRLVEAAAEWSRSRGFRVLRVRTRVTRKRAQRFYVAHGFQITKTQEVLDRPL